MEKETKYEFEILENEDSMRMDKVLSFYLEDTSRNFLQKLIEAGKVFVNNEPCLSKKYKVNKGENISIKIPEAEDLEVEAENIPIEIIYDDEDLLVVNKPKGMVVHPAVGNLTGTLVNALMYHCKDSLSSINGVIRPGIVHRIDKDTSGLLMVAKNDKAHRGLAQQLLEHTITRGYKALVYSNFKEDEGSIKEPIGRDPKNRLKMAVVHEKGKEAITHYKVLERFGDYTLLEARLETGRTHQIRVHMSYIKHPLLGDLVYGPAQNKYKVSGQMLHAYLLGFNHPTKGRYMEFNQALPEEYSNILNKIRGEHE